MSRAAWRGVRIAIVLVVVLAFTRTVSADDDLKSPETATWLSIGVTTGGLALFGTSLAFADRRSRWWSFPMATGLTAVAVGPSTGSLYVQGAQKWSLSGGAGLRLGAGVFAALTAITIALYECDAVPEDTLCDGRVQTTLFGTAAATFVAGAVWDIATVGNEARAYNRAHGLALRPLVAPGVNGLALVGRF
jgi:hypothetical protein